MANQFGLEILESGFQGDPYTPNEAYSVLNSTMENSLYPTKRTNPK